MVPGKSTTVKNAGLDCCIRAAAKSFSMATRSIREDSAAFRRHIGYVPEEPNLYGYLTGLEYLELAGGLRGLPESIVKTKSQELLALLGLEQALRWAADFFFLSAKGMKQRVLIAAALLHDPDVLIFDEAQSGLDIANALMFRYLLLRTCRTGQDGAEGCSFLTCWKWWKRSASTSS